MQGRPRTVTLLAVCLLAATVLAGCLSLGGGPQTVNDTVETPVDETDRPSADRPDDGMDPADDGTGQNASDDGVTSDDSDATSDRDADGSTEAPSNSTDEAETDTASEPERPPNAPESIDEGAAARNVRRAVDDYRQQLGFRGLQRSRGLGVGGAATTNERLVADGPEPPFTLRGTAMNMSTDEVLTMLREQGASSCTGRSKDRAGLLSAARDITSLHTGPGFPEPIPELLAEEAVSSWRSDSSTKGVLEGGYRLGGADVLYESSTGVVYVTVALC